MNKRFLLLSFFLLAAFAAGAKKHRYKGKVLECISGSCVNGEGVATVTMCSDYENDMRDQLRYAGTFKDGLMDGAGKAYKTSSSVYVVGEKRRIYSGHFSEGEMDGYMIEWAAKDGASEMATDSVEDVAFVLYDRGIVDEKIVVQREGLVVNYFGNKDYVNGRVVEGRKIKDEHLKELAAGFIASHKGGFNSAPSDRPVIIAVKTVNVARGRVERFIDWECLTDRKYFVTSSPRGTKNNQMPFGGQVSYQVLAADGAVVFEAPVDTYFTPPKPGKYSFQVMYDQTVIGGSSRDMVDGLQLELSLRSRSL